MANRRDITGQRFGRLIALRLSEETNKRGERYWECVCDCGKTAFVMFSSLNLGRTKSCSCQKRESTIASNKANKSVDPIIRFSQAYKMSPSGCWEWKMGKDDMGYGVLYVNGRQAKAHRFSYEIHVGPIPEHDSYHGIMVCHHCDNPSCVNPDHLFLGLANDNVQDMVAKGRNKCGRGERHGSRTHPEKYIKGEHHYQAKLSEKDVIEIRNSELSKTELAIKYSVSWANIAAIQNRKTWRHI